MWRGGGGGGGGGEIIHLSLHCHHQNDSCHRPQLLKRKENRSGFEPRSLCLPAQGLAAGPHSLTRGHFTVKPYVSRPAAEQRSSSFVTHSSLPPLRQSHTRCSASETGDRWVTGDVTSVCRFPPGAARRPVLNCHYSLTLKRRGRYTRLFELSTSGPTRFKLFIKVTEGLRNVRATD